MVLPQFLFLFQALPTEIPIKYFGQWQKDFNKFVWSSKTHRISMAHLSKPTKLGGLGLPLIHAYYKASQLRTIFTYLRDCPEKSWIQIEEFAIAPYRLRDVLWTAPKRRPRMTYENPYVGLTLKIWDVSRPLLIKSTSLLTSFLSQPWFPR